MSPGVRALVVLVALAAVVVIGLAWRARNGRYTPVAAGVRARAAATPDEAPHDRLTADEIGVPLGTRRTFVQLSSAVCTPCRRTAAVLSALADDRHDVSHVELDVVDRLDLVRRFDVMRTPTVLVLDPRGVVVGRMSGVVDRAHALAALDASVR